jgi:hypothetical protein
MPSARSSKEAMASLTEDEKDFTRLWNRKLTYKEFQDVSTESYKI